MDKISQTKNWKEVSADERLVETLKFLERQKESACKRAKLYPESKDEKERICTYFSQGEANAYMEVLTFMKLGWAGSRKTNK